MHHRRLLLLVAVVVAGVGRKEELDRVGGSPVTKEDLLNVGVDYDASLPFEEVYSEGNHELVM